MTKIKATFEVVTPMFCGDGDPAQSASIRPLSIKGLLRFHFRAVAWRLLKGDLQKIRQYENDLFGSTDRGTGRLRIIVEVHEQSAQKKSKDLLDNNVGLSYLGYGLFGQGGQQPVPARSGLESARFTIHLTLHGKELQKDVKSEYINLLRHLIFSIALIGGLGARNRRGMGSLSLESWDFDGTAQSAVIYPTAAQKLCAAGATFPQYTAWGSDSKVRMVGPSESSLELLNNLGKTLALFRGYGRKGPNDSNHMTMGTQALQKFKPDHDWMLDIHNNQIDSQIVGIPVRSAFGLPHKYFYSSVQGCSQNFGVQPDKPFERRASPLFFKVIKVQGSYYGLISFLPALFLPNGTQIIVQKNGDPKLSSKSVADNPTFYNPVKDFLKFLSSSESKFTQGYEVKSL